MIKFSCHQCGKVLGVRDENAGRKVRCPQCSGVTIAPNEVHEEPAYAEASVQQEQSAGAAYTCSACGGSFDGEQVYSQGDGSFVCHQCWHSNSFTSQTPPESIRQCSRCGGSFDVEHVFTQADGVVVCENCTWNQHKSQYPRPNYSAAATFSCQSCRGSFAGDDVAFPGGKVVCRHCGWKVLKKKENRGDFRQSATSRSREKSRLIKPTTDWGKVIVISAIMFVISLMAGPTLLKSRFIEAAIVAVLFGVCLFFALRTKKYCKKCRKAGGVVFNGWDVLDMSRHEWTERGYEKIYVNEGPSSFGKIIANYKIPVERQRVAVHSTKRMYYGCTLCRHEWTEIVRT